MKGSVAKWGNSLAVRLPKGIAEDARLEEGMEIDMKVEGGRLVVTANIRRYALKDLLAQITPENLHGEVDWGDPQGAEVW